MNDKYSESQFELDSYLKIIDLFQKKELNKKKIDVWKYQSYLSLMRNLETMGNKIVAANVIILILCLFEKKPPDTYNHCGFHVNQLSSSNKKKLINILKNEFLDEFY
ncbi:MAG: hypothetical protein ACFFB0_17810 [Promethearchaeota archaeon]